MSNDKIVNEAIEVQQELRLIEPKETVTGRLLSQRTENLARALENVHVLAQEKQDYGSYGPAQEDILHESVIFNLARLYTSPQYWEGEEVVAAMMNNRSDIEEEFGHELPPDDAFDFVVPHNSYFPSGLGRTYIHIKDVGAFCACTPKAAASIPGGGKILLFETVPDFGDAYHDLYIVRGE